MAEQVEEFEFEETDEFETESQSNVVSLDELKGLKVNKVQDDKVRDSLLLAKGDWNKVESWEPRVEFDSTDKHTGDISSRGRCVVNMYGQVVKGEKTGYIGYKFSPDFRMSRNSTTSDPKPDFFYQSWLKIKSLYERKYEKEADEVIDVVEMAANAQYVLNVDQYNGFNNIKGFK